VSDPRSTHLRGETVDSRREVMEAFVAKLGVTRDAGWRGDVAHIALGTPAEVEQFCDLFLALKPFGTRESA
jgi:hypothetical protein